MRAIVLGVLLTASLAGCLSSDHPPAPADSGEDAARAAETLTLDFGLTPIGYDPRALPVAVADEPYHQSIPFVVPANATSVTAAVTWSCTSLCRIEARLHDPSGAVADRATGAGETSLGVDAPVVGRWAFEWITDEVASVGVEGTVTVTIAFE